jgi:cytochrome c oxidase subunit 2
MVTDGPRADPATALTWGLLVLSVLVIVIITLAVLAGVVMRRSRTPIDSLPTAPVGRDIGGLKWIYIGAALTVAALVAALIWTMQVLAAVDSPTRAPRVTLEVTGHQWWWEVRYVGATPGETFTTANEIHVPVGQPVLIKLFGGDVIHSFWIPALTGKTDTIPGRENLAWLQADHAGVYRGQCTEYCGAQHAHMAAFIVAEPQAAFEAWRQGQLATAAAPADPDTTAGEALMVSRCGGCHTVRGTTAGGVLGPDLTHLMSRRTLASGAFANTPGNLLGWISDPQSAKPGAQMPATYLSGPDLSHLRAYLATLQ